MTSTSRLWTESEHTTNTIYNSNSMYDVKLDFHGTNLSKLSLTKNIVYSTSYQHLSQLRILPLALANLSLFPIAMIFLMAWHFGLSCMPAADCPTTSCDVVAIVIPCDRRQRTNFSTKAIKITTRTTTDTTIGAQRANDLVARPLRHGVRSSSPIQTINKPSRHHRRCSTTTPPRTTPSIQSPRDEVGSLDGKDKTVLSKPPSAGFRLCRLLRTATRPATSEHHRDRPNTTTG